MLAQHFVHDFDQSGELPSLIECEDQKRSEMEGVVREVLLISGEGIHTSFDRRCAVWPRFPNERGSYSVKERVPSDPLRVDFLLLDRRRRQFVLNTLSNRFDVMKANRKRSRQADVQLDETFPRLVLGVEHFH